MTDEEKLERLKEFLEYIDNIDFIEHCYKQHRYDFSDIAILVTRLGAKTNSCQLKMAIKNELYILVNALLQNGLDVNEMNYLEYAIHYMTTYPPTNGIYERRVIKIGGKIFTIESCKVIKALLEHGAKVNTKKFDTLEKKIIKTIKEDMFKNDG